MIETRALGDNAMLAALLEGARPVGLEGDELRLAFAESAAFLKRKAETAEQPRRGRARRWPRSPAAGWCWPTSCVSRGRAGADGGRPAISGDELVARVMAEFDAEELLDEEPLAPAARQESG